MTELLYMQDCYLKEFDAKAILTAGLEIELIKHFLSNWRRQLCDKGEIIFDGKEFLV